MPSSASGNLFSSLFSVILLHFDERGFLGDPPAPHLLTISCLVSRAVLGTVLKLTEGGWLLAAAARLRGRHQGHLLPSELKLNNNVLLFFFFSRNGSLQSLEHTYTKKLPVIYPKFTFNRQDLNCT